MSLADEIRAKLAGRADQAELSRENGEAPPEGAPSRLSDQIRSQLAGRGVSSDMLATSSRRPSGRQGQRLRGGGRGMSRDERQEAAREAWDVTGTFLDRLLRRTGDAVLAMPSAAGDMLAMADAGVQGTVAGLVPGGEGFDYRRRYRVAQEQFPASAIRAIPRPQVDDIVAGGRAVLAAVPGGRTPGDTYREERADLEAREQQQDVEHPLATASGELGGSVAALLLTKKPVQGTIRNLESALMNPRKADDVGEALTGINRMISDAMTSRGVRLPMRGMFRIAEAGVEGAYLEALSEAENDPMLAASLAAGTQTANSVVSSLTSHMLRGGISGFTTRMLLYGGTGAAALQMLKEATPGGRDRVLESIETSFAKVTTGVSLGVLAGLAGSRGRGTEFAERYGPDLIEGMSTVPRVAIMNVLNRWVAAPPDEQTQIEQTLDRIATDPTFRGETALEREVVQQIIGEIPKEPTGREGARGGRNNPRR